MIFKNLSVLNRMYHLSQKVYKFDTDSQFDSCQIDFSEIKTGKDKNGITFYQNLLLGNFEGVQFPIGFLAKRLKIFPDILGTYTVSLFLVSQKFKDLCEANYLTGITFFDVNIVSKATQVLPKYYGLAVSGRAGKIHFDESEIIRKKYSEGAPDVVLYKGIYFDESLWDGSDFFLLENYFGINVSEKAVKVLQSAALTNLRFNPLEDIEFPEEGVEVYLRKYRK